MGRKWDKAHPVKKRFLDKTWRQEHPKYMADYAKLLRLFIKGKIKLKYGERLMDYRGILKKGEK